LTGTGRGTTNIKSAGKQGNAMTLDWELIGILLRDATIIALCVSHWLIWNKLQKIESRLETLELDSITNMRISGEHNYRLANLEVIHAQAIRDRGEGKNNATGPRIYNAD
jgi:hypothetical protein